MVDLMSFKLQIKFAFLSIERGARPWNGFAKRTISFFVPAASVPSALPIARQTAQMSRGGAAAEALAVVRGGVITGERPTRHGRILFSRALDADDAAWCPRILPGAAVEHQPVGRLEAEA